MFGQAGRDTAVHASRHNHLAEILGETDAFDQTDLNTFIAHRGMAFVEPFGIVEDNGDQRAARLQGLPSQPKHREGRHDRDQPDPGEKLLAAGPRVRNVLDRHWIKGS